MTLTHRSDDNHRIVLTMATLGMAALVLAMLGQGDALFLGKIIDGLQFFGKIVDPLLKILKQVANVL